MKVTELQILKILDCEKACLKFKSRRPSVPNSVHIIHATERCGVVALAIRLVCSNEFSSLGAIQRIWERVRNGSVAIKFILPTALQQGRAEPDNNGNPSRDEEPCTSSHPRLRDAQRPRRGRCVNISAVRDFRENSMIIKYSIDGGRQHECSVAEFNKRFFSCTDIIFPQITQVQLGEGCWLDLLSKDFLHKGKGENHLLVQFCKLYAAGPTGIPNSLHRMTRTVLVGGHTVDRARIGQIIAIFQDIRCLFEYLTFSEYTVWFLLPALQGDLHDISDSSVSNIDFAKMRTKLQLSTSEDVAASFCWTNADGYVRELFLVAIQLAFGYNCQQNFLYLQPLEHLNEHQSFEYVRSVFAYNTSATKQWLGRNYLQRIVNACHKLRLTCFMDYLGGMPFCVESAHIIQCSRESSHGQWDISQRS